MKYIPNKKYMRLALAEARKNIRLLRGGPFGACIVKKGKVLTVARNTVLKKNDATCHAEVNAIRIASKKLNTYDLSGCSIYSTTEPCPMCFSAIHWARIGTVVFGTRIKDARRIGFNELPITNHRLKALGKSPVQLVPGFLRDECKKMLDDWSELPEMPAY
ncbi:MAG: nucleoside deaminase [Candidatus Omnitrophota bacterium]